MITKENGFKLNIRWSFPGGREYAFAFIALFVFLLIIYSNSFQGAFQFDDIPNIVENRNIRIETLEWSDIKNTFYGIEGERIDRPLAFFSFAINYYFDKLNVFGYHIVNFLIHYLSSIFLFLFIYNTLNLPKVRERYGPASYSIALLATFFWATSPVQVTAVTYIVQRMASMAGLFYIMALYFYLKGRTASKHSNCLIFFGLCTISGTLSLATKENAIMLPISIWMYDLLLIQGVIRENLIKNLKVVVPVILIITAVSLWYVDILSIFNDVTYKNRPFTLAQRLLTEPRVIIFYISILLYPISSRLTLLHDIDISTSLMTPWSTVPVIVLIILLVAFAIYISRKRPLIAFSILFFFLNHTIESSFIPLELIYEHRNYIPSMFFFMPIAITMIYVMDYFSYKKVIQYTAVVVFTFLMFTQGHTVFERNALFSHPLLLWTDNVIKSPTLSLPSNNLGSEYGKLGQYDEAYEFFSKALILDRYNNLSYKGVGLYNMGSYCLRVAGDPDRALKYLRQAMQASPDFRHSYYEAILCYILRGDIDEAKKGLTGPLSKWPDDAQFHYIHGILLLKSNKYDLAIDEAMQALIINPKQYDALSVLGEAYRRKGNYRMATIYWEQFTEKYPENIQGNLALVELYARQGRRDELARTIEKLMILKGIEKWDKLIDRYTTAMVEKAYSPDREELLSFIFENLNSQSSR